MKGVRFYAESRETVARLKERAANGEKVACFALDIEDVNGRSWRYNPGGAGLAIDGVFSSVCYTSCSLDWLRTKCKRIPESLARKLHPELISYLEA